MTDQAGFDVTTEVGGFEHASGQGPVEITEELAVEVNALYDAVGWNRDNIRTPEKTLEMLCRSNVFVLIRINGTLVGFGRILGDPYVNGIFDVITHPNHRRKGIAGAVLEKLTSFLDERGRASFLIDGSGAPGLYERAGFRAVEAESGERIMYREAPSCG